VQQNRNIGESQLTLDISQRQRSYGFFAQQEWEMSPGWTMFLGGRLDDSTAGKPVFSPKIALVRKTGERSAYKLLYGQAFRNPSTFERYWSPNPDLNAEKMHTLEFAREKELSSHLDVVASVYHYRLSGLIEGVPISNNTLQYQNVESSRAFGAEFELRGRMARSIEAAASASVQRVRYRHGRELPNSPEKIVQVRMTAPVVSSRLWMALSAQYLSQRLTPSGWKTPGAPVADLTLTTNRLHRDFDLQFGVRNLLDRRYFDPMSAEHTLPVMQRAGRSAFVHLMWRYGE
jgi:iron complex outermembrane receptor protein